MQVSSVITLVATWAAAPFAQGRALPTTRPSAPMVDLGYATYQGYHDDTYGLNVWKRYFPTRSFFIYLGCQELTMKLYQRSLCRPSSRQLAVASPPTTNRQREHRLGGRPAPSVPADGRVWAP